MKAFVLLIVLLNFTHSMFCCDYKNDTEDFLDKLCPVHFKRRKRAYTRWRADQDTTSEFILKVLDEDPTTRTSRNVIAVNIQPITKSVKKIIVGGALVQSPKSSPATEFANDYTRFVPPTTLPGTRFDEQYLAQVPNILIEKLNHIRPKAVHPHRDESPPSGPQFLSRTSLISRQFAPVSAVAFNRPTSAGYRTPLTPDDHIFKATQALYSFLTHTPPLPGFKIPHRSSSSSDEELSEIEHKFFSDQDLPKHEMTATRTTFVSSDFPHRTYYTTPGLSHDSIEEILRTSNHLNVIERNSLSDESNEKDSESYNSWFYSDDDKVEQELRETGRSATNLPVSSTEVKSNTFSQDYEYEDTSTIIPKDNLTTTKLIERYDENEDIVEVTSIRTQLRAKEESTEAHEHLICNLTKIRPLDFHSPRTLPEILAQLKKWAEDSPVTKWVSITNNNLTSMENSIYMMIVDDPSRGQIVSAKQTVMIVAGIQGRDHHSVTAAMYVLYQLIERSEAHKDVLTKYRFWIIPVFNPDGYDYSMTFPHRREWSKNLRQNWEVCKGRQFCEGCERYGIGCTLQPCYGVHLDRNFEYQWIPSDELRMEHPCGALYAGKRQLSEPETLAFTNYLHQQQAKLFTFFAFKEGDVLGVMYPHSHTKKKRSSDHLYRQRASRAAEAAYSISGRLYVAGQTSEFLPLYAGGIEDWIEGHLGVDNTYTIMLYRPSDSYNTLIKTEGGLRTLRGLETGQAGDVDATERYLQQSVVHEAFAAMDTLLPQTDVSLPMIRVTGTDKRNVAVLVNKPLYGILASTLVLNFINYFL